MKKLLVYVLVPLLFLNCTSSVLASQLPATKVDAVASATPAAMPVLVSKKTKLSDVELAKYQQMALQLDPKARKLAAAAQGDDPWLTVFAVIGVLVVVGALIATAQKNAEANDKK